MNKRIGHKTNLYISRRMLVRNGAALLLATPMAVLTACGQSTFSIEGKWKVTGLGQYGQMQRGAIVAFDGTRCNVYSPSDTYAFYSENGVYHLDVTGLAGGSPSFTVVVVDNDHIKLSTGSSDTVELTRVG